MLCKGKWLSTLLDTRWRNTPPPGHLAPSRRRTAIGAPQPGHMRDQDRISGL